METIKLKYKTASKEATIISMTGGLMNGNPVDGWHCLTDDSEGSEKEYIALWRQCEEITKWIGLKCDDREVCSLYFGLVDLDQILEQGNYNEKEYCIYVPTRLTDDEILISYNLYKKEKEAEC